MYFCIWSPVTGKLFQAAEYVFPLSSLHVLRKAKSKQAATRGVITSLPAHHTWLLLAMRTGIDKIQELSAKCTGGWGGGGVRSMCCPLALGSPGCQQWREAQPSPATMCLGATWLQPGWQGLNRISIISPNLFLILSVMHITASKKNLCLETSASPQALESQIP